MQPTAHLDPKATNTCHCLRRDFRLPAIGSQLDPGRPDGAVRGAVLADLESDALFSALGDTEGIEPGRLSRSHHDAPPIRLLIPPGVNGGVTMLKRGPGGGSVSGGDIADQEGAVAQGVHNEVGIQSDRWGAIMGHSRLDPDPKIRLLTARAAHLASRVLRAVPHDPPGVEYERTRLALGLQRARQPK